MLNPLEVSAAERWLTEWHTLADEEQIHIVPVGDLVEHERTRDCACGPYREHLEGRDWLYMHASLDGRELLEE